MPVQMLHRRSTTNLLLAATLTISTAGASSQNASKDNTSSNLPRIVQVGTINAAPPSDALILFNGTNLDHWQHANGKNPIGWVIDEDGALLIKSGSGSIITKQSFAAAQIHLEFATPAEANGSGQSRGNSGIYVQGRYEIQVLDSFENETYANGQCGAVYAQYPPLVNASRAPGAWQSYDIIFHPPVLDDDGKKTAGGTFTVLHNGVLIQDHVVIQGPTTAAPFSHETGLGPIYLQDHGSPVRYRNIWLRPLP